mgnify:CR=1 FL=1
MEQLIFDFYNWFDQILRLIAHHEQSFFQMFPAFKYVGYKRMYIKFSGRDKCSQFFHTETSARHQSAVDLFVAHADAPLGAGDIYIGSASEIIYISDFSAWLQGFNG